MPRRPGWPLAGTLKVALLSAMSLVLMLYQVPLFGAAYSYLLYDLSEVPALVAGFALGPAYGVAVVALKDLLFLLIRFRPEELVGVPMNFIAGAAMVGVASWLHCRGRTRASAVVALAAGTAARALAMIPANLVVLPLFFWFFVGRSTGLPLTLVLTVVTAFNLVSGFLTSLATYVIYRRVARFLESW